MRERERERDREKEREGGRERKREGGREGERELNHYHLHVSPCHKFVEQLLLHSSLRNYAS